VAASKGIIVEALDKPSEDQMVKVLDLIRCLLGLAIGKILAVTFPLLLPLSLRVLTAPAQEAAEHVLISEVQVADAEFVELYNPTDEDINMTGWHWCYFSSGRDWNNPYRDKEFPEGATIPAHGFYLIATTSGDFPNADWNLGYSTHFLSNSAGSVGIFPWDPDEKTPEEAKNGRIDAVGWGSVEYVKEDSEAGVPSEGKSIERKAQSASTPETMGPGGKDADRGNGYDSDDNSQDFVLRDSPEPQNSSSSPEIPFGPPATVAVTANPTSIPADGSSISTITATVKDQYGKNVADTTVVTFTTSLGSLGSQEVIKTTANGVATATLTSGTLAGTATITAISDSAFGTTTVNFLPGPPFAVTVTAYPTSIPADGSSTSTIIATVVDQYSNDVADGTVVTFTTDLGSLGSSTVTKATANGVTTATLTTGTTPGIATITATSDSASDQTRVTLFHQGLDPASVMTQVVNNDGTVDNKAGANTEVIITALDTCTVTVVSGLYTNNPGGPPSFNALAGGYIDVQVLDASCASQIEIRLYYPEDTPDERLLRLYWWDGASWRRCSDQRVNTADMGSYGGYIWARVRGDTVPALSDLTGMPAFLLYLWAGSSWR